MGGLRCFANHGREPAMLDDLPPVQDEKAVVSVLASALAHVLQVVALADPDSGRRLLADTRRLLAPVLLSPSFEAGDKVIVDRVLAFADQAIEKARQQVN